MKNCVPASKAKIRNMSATLYLSAIWKKITWKREWFKEAVYMPFENRKIPVPVGYDGRLTAEYGDYMKPAKAPTMHGGLILDPDVPYTEYLKKENK